MTKQTVAASTIIGGILIFAIKIYAWMISDSVALLSDALESIVNIIASTMMFTSIWISERPPDDDHRYGHQKIENISCLIEGILVIIAGVLIGRAAYGRLFTPITLERLDLAVLFSLFATSLNGLLSWFLMKTAEETKSMALEGDAVHLLSDVISSVGVAVGLYIGKILDIPILDPIMALIVSLMVIKMGLDLIWKAGGDLMDESSAETEKDIRKIMDKHQTSFVDYHNLKTRKSGDRIFAELHLSLDGRLSVQEAHDFTDHLEGNVRDELPNVTLTIHIEPERNSIKEEDEAS
jgi:cation diffusion facilitator family transporter